MKVAIVFVLLFATVLCRPARKVSVSSSESSEEMGKQPAAPALRKQAVEATSQDIVAAAAASSDESADSDEDEEAQVATSDSTDTTSSSDTASVNNDSDDDDDDDSEESDTDEDESSDSSESGESSTPATATDTPVIVTEGPVTDSTPEPIEPTIVTDTDTARGDNFGSYPSEYKSIYVEDKSYHKVPSPYKSYEFVGTGKKMAYDMTYGNEVEKSLQVYKALQVHSDVLEEDTSTPEVESQGLDTSYGTSQDEDLSPRQASLPEEDSVSTSEATTSESESTSAPEEEEESESNASESDSVSQESEDEDSQSSEEATATPGAADSDSDESDSAESDSDEGAGPDTTTDMPVVITAK